MIGPKAFVAYLKSQFDSTPCLLNLPKHAIPIFVGFPRPYYRHVPSQSSLHQILSPVKFSHFSRRAKPDCVPIAIEFCWYLAILQQSVDRSWRVESRDARTTSPYPLRQCTLGAEFNSDATREVLLLQSFVVAQKANDKLVDLARLGKQSQPSNIFDPSIVRDRSERMKRPGAPVLDCLDQGVCDTA
jgi:hypothetical protein